MRVDGYLIVADGNDDRFYTADQVISALDHTGAGSARLTMPATYQTSSTAPTVYYTALNPNLTVLTARTTSGVTLLGNGLYRYQQTIGLVTDFIAVWDEGDVNDYIQEYIVVDE